MTVDAAIAQLLHGQSRDERLSAARTIGEADHFQPHTIPALIEALHDVDSEVRLASIDALLRIWRSLHAPASVSPLQLLIRDQERHDPDWQDPDRQAPDEQDPDRLFAPVTPALKLALHDDDKHVRFHAADALRNLYAADDETINVFIASARDPDEDLRRKAAYAFWQGASELQLVLSAAAPLLGGGRAPLHGIDNERVVAVLISLIADTSRDVREYALNAINSIGTTAKATAPMLSAALVAALHDPDELLRFKAACALSSVGEREPAALPVLVAALTNTDNFKRKAAAFALQALGPGAKPVLADLLKALQDEEPRVRARCARALGGIGETAGDEAIHALLALENDPDRGVRTASERALADIGREAVEAARQRAASFKARDSFPLFGFKPEDLPGLIFMLRDPNANIRAYAATAVGLAGGDARAAIPDLNALLKDDDADVRSRAARTLEALGETVVIQSQAT